jgi:hypothetical protein
MREAILNRLPKKGGQRYPLTKRTHTKTGRSKAHWTVTADLHDLAREHGYLTGALFQRPERGRLRFKLLFAGPCPWTPGEIRYYTAPLTQDEIAPFLSGALAP